MLEKFLTLLSNAKPRKFTLLRKHMAYVKKHMAKEDYPQLVDAYKKTPCKK